MKQTSKLTIWLVPLAFAIYILINRRYFARLYRFFSEFVEPISAYFGAYVLIGLPIFITLAIVFRQQSFEAMGLKRSFPKGFAMALLFTLPMFVGYAIVFDFNYDLSWRQIMFGAVFAGFFEELYYRAFFFGLLFRYTRLGFIPSILFGALIFGSFHLYQSNDFGEMAGIFLATFMGAGFFAWLYVEWKYNLWFIFLLHTLMNLSWMLFEAGDNALGGVWSNVFRVMTIALSIIITLQLKRKSQEKLMVNRTNLWIKSSV